MTALDVLEIKHIVTLAHLLESLHKAAGMVWVHPVVLGRGCHQERWVAGIRVQIVIRGIFLQELPVLGVGIAVLSHPACPSQEVRVALHVQQRNGTHHGPKEVWSLNEHVAHQQPAVRPATNPQASRRSHAAGHQVLRNCHKVVVGLLPVLAEGCLVPCWTKLTTATDVRHNIATTSLQPASSNQGRVARGHRDFEAAVTVKQSWCGAVSGQTISADTEIGYLSSVRTRRLSLRCSET
mmetsp:Transcript_45136/g.73201  ORF Transcript_45136/g.73201 Transcript_45136/m.73201 type:complete len:238 (+) Transcript_45136:49-762(+)